MEKRKLDREEGLHIEPNNGTLSNTGSSTFNSVSGLKRFCNFLKVTKNSEKSTNRSNMDLTLSRKSTSERDESIGMESPLRLDTDDYEKLHTTNYTEINNHGKVRFLDFGSSEEQNSREASQILRSMEDIDGSKSDQYYSYRSSQNDINEVSEVCEDIVKEKLTPSRRANYVHTLLSGRSSLDASIDFLNRINPEGRISENNSQRDSLCMIDGQENQEIPEKETESVQGGQNDLIENLEGEDHLDVGINELENVDHLTVEEKEERVQPIVEEPEESVGTPTPSEHPDSVISEVDNFDRLERSEEKEEDIENENSEKEDLDEIDSKEFWKFEDSRQVDCLISRYRSLYECRQSKSPCNEKLRVVVRCRPSTSTRKVIECESSWIKLHKPGDSTSVLKSQRPKAYQFNFDHIVGEGETTYQLYSGSCVDLVEKVLCGQNVTVFAYGSTGSGKTHTITGNESSKGLIYLVMSDLFRNWDERGELYMSYFEVYNESVYDLLQENEKSLQLQESGNVVFVKGLTRVRLENYEDFEKLFQIGNKNRKVFTTKANRCSSRSHSILQVQTNKNSKLTFIDLAGSERMKVTENSGDRLKESSYINQSLLALINCINTLSKNSEITGKSSDLGSLEREESVSFERVKYRDSKLTHLLKNSLSGNCFIVMIAHINPENKFYRDSYNTIKYAMRAKNCEISQGEGKGKSDKEMVKKFSNELLFLVNMMKKQMKGSQLEVIREHISQSHLVGQTILVDLLK